jgi:hypothetical protein
MHRNVICSGLAAALAFAAWAGSAQAQSFPARPVTLIVPWAAGGTTDIGMRARPAAPPISACVRSRPPPRSISASRS